MGSKSFVHGFSERISTRARSQPDEAASHILLQSHGLGKLGIADSVASFLALDRCLLSSDDTGRSATVRGSVASIQHATVRRGSAEGGGGGKGLGLVPFSGAGGWLHVLLPKVGFPLGASSKALNLWPKTEHAKVANLAGAGGGGGVGILGLGRQIQTDLPMLQARRPGNITSTEPYGSLGGASTNVTCKAFPFKFGMEGRADHPSTIVAGRALQDKT